MNANGAKRPPLFPRISPRGRATLDVLTHPLLPYQRAGAMHLAFGERALLADDMGLGKTIQAIAACELLAGRKGVGRVLVVCPASLKAEWEEQIVRFCARPTHLVFGPRAQRLAAYRDPAFFTIVNYEQVLGDADDINALLQPDIVVLDEAQRIKNWQTKTARQVKSLRLALRLRADRHAGGKSHRRALFDRPISRSEIFGPLFRFNRDFYELDERGRPIDYKNLAELRERVAPVMLRRRKADVENGAARTHGQDLFRPDGRGAEGALRRLSPARRAIDCDRRKSVRCARRSSTGCSNCSPACAWSATRRRSSIPPVASVPSSRNWRKSSAICWRTGSQDHRLLRMGADADDGARTCRRDGR